MASPPSQPGPVRRPRPESSTLALWGLAAAFGVAVLCVGAAMALPALRLDWYFDEAWRADMITTPWTFHRYLLHDTPIPPGWLVSNWFVFELVPTRRPLIKLAALVPMLLAAGLMMDTLRRILGDIRPGRPQVPLAVASVTVVLTLLVPGVAALMMYLNNYGVDILVTVALLWACVRIDEGAVRLGTALIVTIGVIGPLITQAGVFVLPAVVGFLLLRWRAAIRSGLTDHARRLRSGAFLTLAAATVSGLLTGILFYLPVAGGGSVDEFWRSESTAGLGAIGWFGRWWTTVGYSVIPGRHGDGVIVQLLLVVAIVHGAWRIGSRFGLWLVAPLSAQLLAWIASLAFGWPITVVRVNMGFQIVLVLTAVAGAVLAAEQALTRLPSGRALASTVLVAGAVWLAWPSEMRLNAISDGVYARGLTDDLEGIVSRSRPGEVVLSYHGMASWYHHMVMVDRDTGLIVLDELEFGHRITTDPDALVAEAAPAATAVWCTMPFEIGPEGTENACQLDPDRWEVVEESRHRRITLVRLALRRDLVGSDG